MEQNNQQEAIYIKGFNHGYIIAEHEPELQEKLIQSKAANNNDYFQGLTDGGLEYQSEQMAEQLKQVRQNQKNKDKGRKR